MHESRKDQVEDASSAVVEALISLIPGVGGPLAVLANRALGSAFERRTVRILEELRASIEQLEAAGLVDEDRADSEAVQASIHKTIRLMLEASSDDRRTLLRNALLHQIMGEDGDPFDEALDRVHPSDLPVLQHIARFGARMPGPAVVAVRGGREDTERTRLLKLERLGLLEEVDRPGHLPPESKIAFARSPSRHLRLSSHGQAFLEYVRSPSDRGS